MSTTVLYRCPSFLLGDAARKRSDNLIFSHVSCVKEDWVRAE